MIIIDYAKAQAVVQQLIEGSVKKFKVPEFDLDNLSPLADKVIGEFKKNTILSR